MTVKDLIEKLEKIENKDNNVYIKFALDKDDEIGYCLEPIFVENIFKNDVVIYAEYTATKEDCDFIGQVDLKEVFR